MEALDEVTGATGNQLHELTKAFTSNNNVLNFFADAAELATKIKVGCIGNIPLAYAMENLDEVSGGTCDQLHELSKALMSNNEILGFFADAAEFASKYKLGCLGNIPLAYAMEDFLAKDMGIKANISVGWGGSGYREVGNSYTDMATGKALSHSDVVQRLKNYGNEIL